MDPEDVNKKHAQSLMRSMFKMQQQSFLTDVTIVCKDGLLYAHSIVLAAASSTLMNMLSQYSKGLALGDYHVNDVQALIAFIYTGKLLARAAGNPHKIELLLETFKISVKDDVTNVKSKDVEGIKENITGDDQDVYSDEDDKNVDLCFEGEDNIKLTTKLPSNRIVKERKGTLRNQRVTKHKRHKRPSTVNVRPKCDICHRKIATYRLLIYHKHRKHNVPYSKEDEEKYFYKCDFTGCQYKSHLLHLIKRHKEKVHEPAERTIPCDQCGKMFPNADALRSHSYRHKMPDVQCHVCGANFKKEYLKGHMKRHHEKPTEFQCPHCEYKCVTKRHFVAHLNKSHGDSSQGQVKTFKCVHCDYSTSEGLPKLMNHINYKHAVTLGMKQKDCTCHICGKSFSCNDYLKNHMVLHTNPNRFKCLHCKYSTSSQTSIDSHVRTQHVVKDTKPWKCVLCEFSAKFRGNLKKHLLNKHKLPEEQAASIMKTVKASGSVPRAAELSAHYSRDPRYVSGSQVPDETLT